MKLFGVGRRNTPWVLITLMVHRRPVESHKQNKKRFRGKSRFRGLLQGSRDPSLVSLLPPAQQKQTALEAERTPKAIYTRLARGPWGIPGKCAPKRWGGRLVMSRCNVEIDDRAGAVENLHDPCKKSAGRVAPASASQIKTPSPRTRNSCKARRRSEARTVFAHPLEAFSPWRLPGAGPRVGASPIIYFPARPKADFTRQRPRRVGHTMSG